MNTAVKCDVVALHAAKTFQVASPTDAILVTLTVASYGNFISSSWILFFSLHAMFAFACLPHLNIRV